MEVVGAVGGIIALAKESLKLCDSLRRCYKNLKGASEDIRRIRSEIQTFGQLLGRFEFTVSQSEATQPTLSVNIKESIIPCIISDGEHAVSKIKQLIKKLRPLRSDKKATLFEIASAKIWWLNRRLEVFETITQLNCVKQSAAWLINMMTLDLLMVMIATKTPTQLSQDALPGNLISQMSVYLDRLSEHRC